MTLDRRQVPVDEVTGRPTTTAERPGHVDPADGGGGGGRGLTADGGEVPRHGEQENRPRQTAPDTD